MTRDLRRRALESNKTISRKAKSAQNSVTGSQTNSPAASRTTSRVASRNPSDDESDFSDSATNFSVGSIDDSLADDIDQPTDAWMRALEDRIGQITDRKRSSMQGREDSLDGFTRIIMAHYVQKEISSRIDELVPAILKSVKGGASERETILALKAISVLLITSPSDTVYDVIAGPIKMTISDSQYAGAKIAAIHALGAAVFYGGASLDETQDVMTMFLEIIESDGASADASDNGVLVTAALEEWGFLATQLDDMEETSEEAMDALVDQLDASDINVQIASGENIALLFEKSFTELEDDEEPEQGDVGVDEDDTTTPMRKRYTVYRRKDHLIQKLEELAGISSRRMSKKDRKTLHTNFADILNSVEYPNRGPRYSTAENFETGKAYGSRMSIKVGKNRIHIRTWEQLHRLKALRRTLQGGFLVHYSDNEVIFDTLPVMVQ